MIKMAGGGRRRVVLSGILRLILCILLFLAGSGVVRAASPPRKRATGAERVIVRLALPPVMVAQSVSPGPDLQTALDFHQQGVIEALQKACPGCVVECTYRSLFDGLAVRLPGGNRDLALSAIAQIPGVTAIYDDVPYSPTLFASSPLMDVPEAWDLLGGVDLAGAGIKISIIDSGVAIDHAMLSEAEFSYPDGYPRGDARYCTPKVITSRLYVRPTDPPVSGEDSPVPGPLGSGHGTYLAAIAAGSEITATYKGVDAVISGVAPQAWIMNYRVFYPGTAETGVAYSAELIAAIEDAVADGADVILAGWSSSSATVPNASPVAQALEMATQAGIVVVTAAGNDGPTAGSASRVPGGMESVITVGSATKDAVIVDSLVDVVSPEPVMAALQNIPYGPALFGPQISPALGPTNFVSVARVDPQGSDLACAPLPSGSLEGKVALIRRGECSFADKVYHAQQGGAAAVIIANDEDEVAEMACAGDYCEAGVISIPSIMVSKSDGDALEAWATLWPTATLRIDPTGRVLPEQPDLVAEYSARGPAYASTLKPDLAAPGDAVLSAYAGDGGPYTQLSGTSVAAAQVAGCAALLLQQHPTWGHEEVKQALMGTCDRPSSDNPLARGAGRVNVGRAIGAQISVSPPSLSLAHCVSGHTYDLPLTVRDLRKAGGVTEWQIEMPAMGGITVAGPDLLTTVPGQVVTTTLQVQVQVGTPAGDATGDMVFSAASQTCALPTWVHVDPLTTCADLLVIDNDFSQFGSYTDYAPYVIAALQEGGYSYEQWDADAHYGNPQTIPDVEELQEYPAILWLTGDNVHPDGYFALSTPLTALDQEILMRYLDGGGRLLAIGQNLAEASDVNPDSDPVWGRSNLYHGYLGAHWIQGSLYDPDGVGALPPDQDIAVVGLPGTFLSGVQIDLGSVGDGAGNQDSVDEAAPGGTPDLADVGHVTPILAALGGSPDADGYTGLAKACEPTIEGDAACAYRTVYLSFGLEGINQQESRTTRKELLDRTLAWLFDKVTVTAEDATWAPHELFTLSCVASSTLGGGITSYRWHPGVDASAEIITSPGPSVSLSIDQEGTYAYSVQATDSLGHNAVDDGTIRILYGGNSTLTASASEATPGREIVYQVEARNTGPDPLDITARLDVPTGTAYVSHTGGGYEDGTLELAATVPPSTSQIASMRVVVEQGA